MRTSIQTPGGSSLVTSHGLRVLRYNQTSRTKYAMVSLSYWDIFFLPVCHN